MSVKIFEEEISIWVGRLSNEDSLINVGGHLPIHSRPEKNKKTEEGKEICFLRLNWDIQLFLPLDWWARVLRSLNSDRHLPCCCSWFCLLDVDWYYAIRFAGPPAFGERIMKFLSFQDHMSQFFMTNESFHISIHISSIGLFFWKSLLHTCYKIEKWDRGDIKKLLSLLKTIRYFLSQWLLFVLRRD